jgi:hypothetical protein
MEGRKKERNEKKKENLVQNKIQDFKNIFFFKSQNFTISLPVKREVCEKITFLSASS